MSRHGRLQRQVLSLYRELLRAGRGGAEARVRAEFQQHTYPQLELAAALSTCTAAVSASSDLRSGHATAMGAFVRTDDRESNGAGAPGTLSNEGDDRRPLR